jgi:hypothetical protein
MTKQIAAKNNGDGFLTFTDEEAVELGLEVDKNYVLVIDYIDENNIPHISFALDEEGPVTVRESDEDDLQGT